MIKLSEYFELVKPYELSISNRNSKFGRPITFTMSYYEKEWHYYVRDLTKEDISLIEEKHIIQILEEMKQKFEIYLKEREEK